jgi:hypothetical protein
VRRVGRPAPSARSNSGGGGGSCKLARERARTNASAPGVAWPSCLLPTKPPPPHTHADSPAHPFPSPSVRYSMAHWIQSASYRPASGVNPSSPPRKKETARWEAGKSPPRRARSRTLACSRRCAASRWGGRRAGGGRGVGWVVQQAQAGSGRVSGQPRRAGAAGRAAAGSPAGTLALNPSAQTLHPMATLTVRTRGLHQVDLCKVLQ